MKESNSAKDNSKDLDRYISRVGAWALAIGTSLGWGSFVVTGNTYLSQAGPLGSSLGLLFGMVVMMLIGRNYHYMMVRYPDSGGAYTYAKKTFGYDYGFLTSWFLALTYIAMFWANATSVPLFARYFLGDILHFGFHYTLFNYEIYFGEILITAVSIVLIGLLCMYCKRVSVAVVIVMAVVFTAGIAVCFAVSLRGMSGSGGFEPLFVPGGSAFSQVLRIASMSSWAFIGFENISNSSEEFTFPKKKVFRIFVAVILMTTALYIFVMLLSVTAYPPEYRSWLEYIKDLDNIRGIKGLPAFYAAEKYMGRAGIFILIMALLSLIVTSLIGNLLALSRLMYALAKDNVLPKGLAALNKNNIPYRTIAAVVLVSLLIPFFGRSAVGWIVDVTTIGATIIYGLVSAAVFKAARANGDTAEMVTGAVGVLFMFLFGIMLMLPNLISTGSMATESYFLFAVWAVLGFIYFRRLLVKNNDMRFGKSLVVWVALLLLILMSTLTWMSYSVRSTTNDALENIGMYYGGYSNPDAQSAEAADYMAHEMSRINIVGTRSTIVVIGLFMFSLCIMMNNYSIMSKRELEKERQLHVARNIANTDPLTGVKSKHAYGVKESQLDSGISSGEVNSFAIGVFDVNGLKQINDTLGHKAGDEYIRSACRIICQIFKHSPVYRIGGDEFVVVLEGQDYLARDALMAELNSRIEMNQKHGDVVIAGGISDFDPEIDEKVLTVFERADSSMYIKKKELKGITV